jgi:hypothetical protein
MLSENMQSLRITDQMTSASDVGSPQQNRVGLSDEGGVGWMALEAFPEVEL